MKMTACFSSDRRHRWWLTREWGKGPWCAVIGLNPSTADENQNDPTIRRCITFAQSWEHGGLLMLNLYAYRATDPRDLWAARKHGLDIIGDRNYYTDLLHCATVEFPQVSRIVAAWGNAGGERGINLGIMAKDAKIKLDCLMKSAKGVPLHPLYLPSGLFAEPWNYKAEPK